MLKYRTTNRFEKDFVLSIKRNCNIAEYEILLDLLLNQKKLPDRYRNHKLGGPWKGFHECHIAPDWLLIYEKTKTHIYVQRMGTHSDLFG